MALSPSSPRFAFAKEGSIAWTRDALARIVAIDASTGAVVREVELDPVPFGMSWRIERHGAFFVVRDDHEISAYDDASGKRLWKRTSSLKVSIVAERDGRHLSVVPDADGSTFAIALVDLATGAIDAILRLEGTMRFIGANGTLVGDMLFVATDERDLFVVDVSRLQVVQRHALGGTHPLPPIVTQGVVHVAAVDRRDGFGVTYVSSVDPQTGEIVATHPLAGAAHELVAGQSGVLVDLKRTPHGAVERVAFRPENPDHQLSVTVRGSGASGTPEGRAGLVSVQPAPSTHVHSARMARVPPRASRRDELVPEPRDGSEGAEETPADGLRGLLALLDARSDVLSRIAERFEARRAGPQGLLQLGLTFRDPRARWVATAGRDPSLVDLAETREGDALATCFYPPARAAGQHTGRLPVVLVSRTTGKARWLADDFDVWFASVVHEAAKDQPMVVLTLLAELGLPRAFPAQACPPDVAPRYFFEAHETSSFDHGAADAALAAGDLEGAERILVALGRDRPEAVKERLVFLYERLGWAHHRATVVETW